MRGPTTCWDLDVVLFPGRQPTGVTETNGELCRQYQKSAASAPAELNDRPYQKLLTDPEGLEQLGHHGRQSAEYLESTRKTAVSVE